MNTFKTQFLTLESTVKLLQERLQKLEGTVPATSICHYVTSEQESGELSLECMDTFRFIYTTPPNKLPNYTPTSGHQNPTCYTYTLINPSEDIKNYYTSQAQIQRIHPTEYSVAYPHGGLQILTEASPDKLEQSDIQFSRPDDNNPGYRRQFSKTKEMKEALAEKFFACSKKVNEFAYTETVHFKQEYEILPHVSFFVTPLATSNILCKIIELTKKTVTFETRYADPMLHTPSDAILHWQVCGIPKSHAHIDLLSD